MPKADRFLLLHAAIGCVLLVAGLLFADRALAEYWRAAGLEGLAVLMQGTMLLDLATGKELSKFLPGLVLAVAALAKEHIPLLIGGLLLSILILMVGSALVAELINRLPWLLDVAALVLGWTASNMILHDLRLGPILEQQSWTAVVVPVVLLGAILVADVIFRLRRKPAIQQEISTPND